MRARRVAIPLLASVVASLGAWFGLRPRSSAGREPEATTVRVASPSPSSVEGPAIAVPPRAHEVRQALARVFGDALVWPHAPAFVSADFNGDASADLAVAAEPAAGAVEVLNSPLANWVVQDPRRDYGPGRSSVERGSPVLAVIHGHGRLGWRDPEARQAYLLPRAVGRAMETRRPAAVPAGSRAARGDVIAQVLGGRRGFLYWTGSRYAWRERSP